MAVVNNRLEEFPVNQYNNALISYFLLTTFIRLIRISTEPTRCFDLARFCNCSSKTARGILQQFYPLDVR
jgi:hypothetical protein